MAPSFCYVFDITLKKDSEAACAANSAGGGYRIFTAESRYNM
jgi:hypothetical protein